MPGSSVTLQQDEGWFLTLQQDEGWFFRHKCSPNHAPKSDKWTLARMTASQTTQTAATANHEHDIPVPLFKSTHMSSLTSKAVSLRIALHNGWGARPHTAAMMLLLLPLNLVNRAASQSYGG